MNPGQTQLFYVLFSRGGGAAQRTPAAFIQSCTIRTLCGTSAEEPEGEKARKHGATSNIREKNMLCLLTVPLKSKPEYFCEEKSEDHLEVGSFCEPEQETGV